MIPTPDLSHLTKEDFQYVYEPAGMHVFHHGHRDLELTAPTRFEEDTFLLLDALEADAKDLKKMAPTLCLEIG